MKARAKLQVVAVLVASLFALPALAQNGQYPIGDSHMGPALTQTPFAVDQAGALAISRAEVESALVEARHSGTLEYPVGDSYTGPELTQTPFAEDEADTAGPRVAAVNGVEPYLTE